jgi:hypothetical protein
MRPTRPLEFGSVAPFDMRTAYQLPGLVIDVPGILCGNCACAISPNLRTFTQWDKVFSSLQMCRWSGVAICATNPTLSLGQCWRCTFHIAVIAAQHHLFTLPREYAVSISLTIFTSVFFSVSVITLPSSVLVLPESVRQGTKSGYF